MKNVSEPRHAEPHLSESSGIRDFVFGFGDGINTSLGIAAGVGGADVSSNIIILAALVGMFTGAKAMAVQNYLAVKAQRELLRSEIAREEWEIDNKPDIERKEIEEIYRAKGFDGKDLEMVVNKITSNRKVWLDTMLTEELKLNIEVVGNPIKSAFRMFGAFLVGGILPIIPFFFLSGYLPLVIAIGISLSTSFMVGAVKSRLAQTNVLKGGLEMAGLGTGIALVGFGIGTELANFGIIDV
ncbi:VIT1/CCC1 transporter family protein [Candidatus Nitrosotenuis cloacae]|uniref:VIT1/CCC1 transporter family protein n=1 Tax=Candidatus Nitrosotenuis cloacae TaxID=1603555 RepID=UPI00227E39AD|nr:VIT1/CCC1 transporter family protein [Candidatus Nitrosotenuis cloacae]